MAIEAPPWQCRLRNDWRLIEGVDIALVDTDIPAHLVSRRNASVGESIIIEGILTHIDGEVEILRPLSSRSCTHCDGELAAHILTG